nr:MAG TPA: hypothetical protein [Caudoviricetes sp.]
MNCDRLGTLKRAEQQNQKNPLKGGFCAKNSHSNMAH